MCSPMWLQPALSYEMGSFELLTLPWGRVGLLFLNLHVDTHEYAQPERLTQHKSHEVASPTL